MHVACGVAYDEVSGTARFNYQSRLVLLLGMPRSGTTWLAKILDSHPETLYRHEPEIVHRHDKIPYSCTREDASAYVGAMQARLNLLVNDRSARTVGSRPVFAKSFHTPRQTVLRRMMIGALKSVGRIPSVGRWSNSVQVPDFVDLRSDSVKRIIIKSIGAPMERIEIIKAAAPGLQFILLVRHPCGQVASMLRGIRWSKFEHPIGVPEPNTAARQRGLTKEALARMSLVAQLAWNWVIRNELALEALRGAAHVRIVRYEDLARRSSSRFEQTLHRLRIGLAPGNCEICPVEQAWNRPRGILRSTTGSSASGIWLAGAVNRFRNRRNSWNCASEHFASAVLLDFLRAKAMQIAIAERACDSVRVRRRR